MHTSVTLAASWIDVGNGLGGDFKDLVFKVGIPAMCGVFVFVVGWKTKAPGPTIAACFLAAIVWGLSANMDDLQGNTSDTINEYDGGPGIIGGDQ
ncbi:hypothetical protein ABT390_35440 [Streptomyces aurantiacus]|uniref:Uncharacterized protein n=1 Tax=Streptomyces aurantiacus JA 4570 TaxID=1286094 RepID=S4AHM1_9ACTN|nr:hypothetical protein [Streptomyces aurantiacus]EPH40947.1 hypothetical protein STRAU_5989 [Streptomyces aurantiacus JA 4570]